MSNRVVSNRVVSNRVVSHSGGKPLSNRKVSTVQCECQTVEYLRRKEDDNALQISATDERQQNGFTLVLPLGAQPHKLLQSAERQLCQMRSGGRQDRHTAFGADSGRAMAGQWDHIEKSCNSMRPGCFPYNAKVLACWRV